MAEPLENQPWWGEVLASLKSEGLRALARRHSVTVAELRAALARTGQVSDGGAVTPTRRPRRAPAREVGRGTASARLEAARGELGQRPDGEIADRLGIARKTVVEFRKRHGIEPYVAPRREGTGAREEAPPGATGRASRLDAFREIIGVLPDRVVAERAGMTTENVRMYRQRRAIPASWREEPPAAPPEGAGRSRRGRQPTAPGESKVERALAPFLELLGSATDAEVAGRAGVSRSAVSAYRARYHIPAGVTRPAREAEEAPLVAPAARSKSGATLLYRVTATRDGRKRNFGLFAADPVEAARRAWEALTARDERWVIRSIRLLGEALPE